MPTALIALDARFREHDEKGTAPNVKFGPPGSAADSSLIVGPGAVRSQIRRILTRPRSTTAARPPGKRRRLSFVGATARIVTGSMFVFFGDNTGLASRRRRSGVHLAGNGLMSPGKQRRVLPLNGLGRRRLTTVRLGVDSWSYVPGSSNVRARSAYLSPFHLLNGTGSVWLNL